jgi:hypothetical protein
MMYVVIFLMKKRSRQNKQGTIAIRYLSEGSSNDSLPGELSMDEKRETVPVTTQPKKLQSWNDPAFAGLEESGLNEKQYQAYRRLHGQASVRESLTRLYQNARSHFSFGSTTRQSGNNAPYNSGLSPVPNAGVPPIPLQKGGQDEPEWPMTAHVNDNTAGYGRANGPVTEYRY